MGCDRPFLARSWHRPRCDEARLQTATRRRRGPNRLGGGRRQRPSAHALHVRRLHARNHGGLLELIPPERAHNLPSASGLVLAPAARTERRRPSSTKATARAALPPSSPEYRDRPGIGATASGGAAGGPSKRVAPDATALGVIQQRDCGESRGRTHARPVVEADDRFRRPIAAAQRALRCDQATGTSASPLPRSGSSGPAQPRDRLPDPSARTGAVSAGSGCTGSAPFGTRSREPCNRRHGTLASSPTRSSAPRRRTGQSSRRRRR
jgi:hypothetical protein